MTLTPTNIPDTEPEIVFAGQTLQWTRSLSDYPADTYVLKYYLSGPASITLTATAYNATDHLISESSVTTSAWTYGIYSWQAYAEATVDAVAQKWTVGAGFLTVKTAAGKSFAKTMLDAIEAILTGRGTSKDLDLVSKSPGGSANMSRDPEFLMKLRDKFRAEYQTELDRESRINGKSAGSKIRVRWKSA